MSRGGYFDLNITVDRRKSDHLIKLSSVIRAAYKLGYDTVAINTVVDVDFEVTEECGSGKRKKKSATTKNMPNPLELSADSILTKADKIPGRKLKILQRLTVPLKDPSSAYNLSSAPARLYDILAVQPLNDKALQVCVNTLDVDIISFRMSERIPFRLRNQQIGVAQERGMFFEISYAPALIDTTARRNAICFGRHIVDACRGKNIIVTSETERTMDLRGPYDVINLCNLFGLKEHETAKILSTNGRQLVLKSECRLSGKGAFVITSASQLPAEDQWKTLHCQNDLVESIVDETIKKVTRTKKRLAGKTPNGKQLKKKMRAN